jgi:hypothetical protein
MLALALPACAQERPSDETRAQMQGLFESLRSVLPMVSNEEALGDPASAEALKQQVLLLATRAGLLEEHTRDLDLASSYTGQTLAREALQSARHLERGDLRAVAFSVRQLTSQCAACHMRREDRDDAVISLPFAADESLRSLPAPAQARMLTATRRFEDAMEVLEAHILSSDVAPLELLGPLTQYLVLSIRVKREPQRPLPVLADFSQRDDLWLQLDRDIDAWISYLRELPKRPTGGDPLERAEALMSEARAVISYPTDRRGLVHFIFASRDLHDYVAEHGEPDLDLARAFYMLGVAESRIGRSFWSSEAAFYLEAAVRTAPGDPVGRSAYAVLEEETLVGFTGSGGLRLPEDVSQNLRELRELMAVSQPVQP